MSQGSRCYCKVSGDLAGLRIKIKDGWICSRAQTHPSQENP